MILLITLFFCHYLADFTPLSRPFMLEAKRFGKPLGPILQHAFVHGAVMWMPLIIACGENEHSQYLPFFLYLFQVSTHFVIDTLKGRVNGWFPQVQSPANSLHWIVFGFDQFLHAVVIILMVGMINN